MRVKSALILSDLHFGWVPVRRKHARLLDALDAAADDAELIIFNGDIIDGHRGQLAAGDDDLVARLCEKVEQWRNDGRQVIYVEGNHDPADGYGSFVPDRWYHDFVGANGERVRVLHGHRFSDDHQRTSYERFGRRFLRIENHVYNRARVVAWLYPASLGWIVGGYGKVEDIVGRRGFFRAVDRWSSEFDVLVHGHFHFGPGHTTHGSMAMFRSGAWVSRGHRGSADRMLRYRDGRFERITLRNGTWHAPDDGR